MDGDVPTGLSAIIDTIGAGTSDSDHAQIFAMFDDLRDGTSSELDARATDLANPGASSSASVSDRGDDADARAVHVCPGPGCPHVVVEHGDYSSGHCGCSSVVCKLSGICYGFEPAPVSLASPLTGCTSTTAIVHPSNVGGDQARRMLNSGCTVYGATGRSFRVRAASNALADMRISAAAERASQFMHTAAGCAHDFSSTARAAKRQLDRRNAKRGSSPPSVGWGSDDGERPEDRVARQRLVVTVRDVRAICATLDKHGLQRVHSMHRVLHPGESESSAANDDAGGAWEWGFMRRATELVVELWSVVRSTSRIQPRCVQGVHPSLFARSIVDSMQRGVWLSDGRVIVPVVRFSSRQRWYLIDRNRGTRSSSCHRGIRALHRCVSILHTLDPTALRLAGLPPDGDVWRCSIEKATRLVNHVRCAERRPTSNANAAQHKRSRDEASVAPHRRRLATCTAPQRLAKRRPRPS